MTEYDSTLETRTHIHRVRALLHTVGDELQQRAFAHDASKLQEPEKTALDTYTPLLQSTTYSGPPIIQSDDFQAYLQHHYANNSHHPEHYPNGIAGMSLFDLIEMICDWKAAGERHKDGSMQNSLETNRTRFQIDDQLYSILVNTAREMGWIV